MPGYSLALAIGGLLVAGSLPPWQLADDDKAEIIRVLINAQGSLADYKGTCVRPYLKSRDDADEAGDIRFPLKEAELPTPLKVCSSQIEGPVFTFHDPEEESVEDWVSAKVDWVCGAMCGRGEYYILTRDGKTWRITEKRVRWVS